MPNVNLSDGFAERLRALRIARHLSEADLAERAGLTYKTIRELETGRRRRVMERTVLSLASAFAMPVEELLGASPAGAARDTLDTRQPGRRRRLVLALAAFAAILGVAALSVVSIALDRATWELTPETLTVRDGLFGTMLWYARSENSLRFCEPAPWDGNRLLLGLGSETTAGGRLLCIDRASGDTLWSAGPDIAAMVDAFGAETVQAANFNCADLRPVDLDGDGVEEVAVRFIHGLLYPAAICVIDRDGRRRSQYANRGHISSLLVVDLDGDGKDEIVAAGTNNALAYQGATVIVLDEDNCSGASVDAGIPAVTAGADSSAARLILPQFPAPYMELCGVQRLTGRNQQCFRDEDGRLLINLDIRAAGEISLNATIDRDLRPVRVIAADRSVGIMHETWPDSLVHGTGPADAAWLRRWLDGYVLFHHGRPVPHETPPPPSGPVPDPHIVSVDD